MANPEALKQDVQFLKGVGPKRAKLLQRLGIQVLEDLLWHFPRTYEEFSGLKKIDQLVEEEIQTVIGEVVEIEGRETAKGKQIISIVVHDGSSSCLEGVWFNQTWVASKFHHGQKVAFTGKAKWYRDHWQITTPDVQPVEDIPVGNQETAIIPVYPLTENLQAEKLQAILRRAVEEHAGLLPERLPESLRQQRKLPHIEQAIRDIHIPQTMADARSGKRRFIYEEFLLLQLALAFRRREFRLQEKAPKLPVNPAIDSRIRRLFPFQLTADQNRVAAEISKDLASDRPMRRLLQADVGAGKTAVAVYALLVTVANKHQAAIMAPTEVLARQHWRTLEGYLSHSRVRRLLLTGSMTPKAKRLALAEIAAGQADLVVGTQALVQEAVEFARLGLVIIDEQHKFGVNQRARFRNLGVEPHYLVMTATPIPRTIALTTFGDLDVSNIQQLPPGRQPVVTKWVRENNRQKVYQQVETELRQGKQLFVVCPLVEESESLDLKAAEQTYQELRTGPLADFRVGLLHGRIDDRAKDEVMQKFHHRQLDVLVSTVVIEVGVDVPNATLMIIEHADRFGLSQLHQLRGRVSRGKVAGQCFLFAGNVTAEAEKRLRALTKTTDGFRLAELDARLRGQGQLFGTRQHGLGELRFGNLLTDQEILRMARQDAFNLVKDDPELSKEEHVSLREEMIARYGEKLNLAGIG